MYKIFSHSHTNMPSEIIKENKDLNKWKKIHNEHELEEFNIIIPHRCIAVILNLCSSATQIRTVKAGVGCYGHLMGRGQGCC